MKKGNFNTSINLCQIVQEYFLEEMAPNPKGGRSIVTPKNGKATVSVDIHNVVGITIGYVRMYRDGGECRNSLHYVGRVDVLPQRQNSDDGRGRVHPSKSDHTMLNCSRCWIGDGLLDEDHDGMVSSGVECRSLHVMVRVALSLEGVWRSLERCELGCHRM